MYGGLNEATDNLTILTPKMQTYSLMGVEGPPFEERHIL